MYFVRHVSNNKGFRTHSSDANSVLNCAFDNRSFYTWGLTFFYEIRSFQQSVIKEEWLIIVILDQI